MALRLDQGLVAVCGKIGQSIVHGFAAAGAAHCCRPFEYINLFDLIDQKTELQSLLLNDFLAGHQTTCSAELAETDIHIEKICFDL